MTAPKTFDIRLETMANPAGLALSNYAFVNSPAPAKEKQDDDYLTSRSTDKVFYSYVDDEAIAKVGVTSMQLNVRGKVMPMGGISGVASMPSARRGGHIRALMQRSIEEMRADGQAVSTLYPFKTTYYEMFGYAGWQVPMWFRCNPAALSPYLAAPKNGSIKHRLLADDPDAFITVRDAMLQRVHGFSTLPNERVIGGAKEHPQWMATVHEGDELTGAMTYTMKLDKEAMPVHAFWYLTENARVQLLDFLARHVDQIKQVRMPILPDVNPYLWASDDGSFAIISNEEHAWNAPMARIVDIAGLKGVPVGDSQATITITDPQASWNEGTWTFTGKNGELQVSQGGEPGGTVSVNALAALVFSGIDTALLPIRGWGEVNDETAAGLRSLFPPATPYIHEQF